MKLKYKIIPYDEIINYINNTSTHLTPNWLYEYLLSRHDILYNVGIHLCI